MAAKKDKSKIKPVDHWKGMPEFSQLDKKPYKQVIVSFETAEDMHKFAKLVGQKLSAKTQSIWFPAASIETYMDKRYTDKKKK